MSHLFRLIDQHAKVHHFPAHKDGITVALSECLSDPTVVAQLMSLTFSTLMISNGSAQALDKKMMGIMADEENAMPVLLAFDFVLEMTSDIDGYRPSYASELAASLPGPDDLGDVTNAFLAFKKHTPTQAVMHTPGALG